MKCSKCKGSNVQWQGCLLKAEDGWKALVSVVCSNCKRTYQADIDWKQFELKQIGGFVDGKPPKEPEELMEPGKAQELIDNFAQQKEMPWANDPRGR